MARLGLTFLGDFQARFGPDHPVRLRTRKTQALLAYLALPSGPPHSREKLAALLWGDQAETQARSRLRETLFALRRALAPADPPCLVLTGETVGLRADAVDIDVASFERLIEASDERSLTRAAELYRGDFLAGLAFRGTLFEDWLMTERERLRELVLETLARLLAQQRARGAVEAALQTALRLIALDPLQEPVHRTLMHLYADLGRRASALHQYQLCVGILQRELGVEPEDETKRLYQLILSRPSQSPSPMTVDGPPSLPVFLPASDTALIGRDSEMARLRVLLSEAVSGRGRVAALLGEAGVGKTRLMAELAAEVDGQGRRLLLGRCHESEQILPFGPWVDALGSGRVVASATWLESLSPVMRRELGRLLPDLGPVVGETAVSADYLKLFEAITLLLRHLAERQPIALVLEDLHWSDEMSLRLLAFVSHRLQAWPLLLLVTARQEELVDASMLQRALAELEREPHVATLALRPLSRHDTLGLVHALARPGSHEKILAPLGEQVWRASGGNPFVVIEAMRAANREELPPALEGLSLPERVRDIVSRQLDRLDQESRNLAAVASVIGREFEFRLLHAVSGLGEDDAARGVEELVRRGVLHSEGDRLDFTHDRVRDVVYGQLLAPRRRMLHRRVAEALTTVHAENLGPHHLALGLHYAEGEVWEQAVVLLRQAGTRAMEQSAYREALVCLERALEALAHLPETPSTLEQAFDLRIQARERTAYWVSCCGPGSTSTRRRVLPHGSRTTCGEAASTRS